MYSIEFTNQYLKDLRLARKRQLDEKKLNSIILLLAQGESLPKKYMDHALQGKYTGYRECHIQPDWLLLYTIDKEIKIIRLIRTGSHSDLF